MKIEDFVYQPPEIVEEMVRRGELPPPPGGLLALDDDTTTKKHCDQGQVEQEQGTHTTPPTEKNTPCED